MKPEVLVTFLEALTDRRRLLALREVYRRRAPTAERPHGGATAPEVEEATGLTREQAVNALTKLLRADLLRSDHAGWDKRLLSLPDTPIRAVLVEVCKLLDGGEA
jgi:hypothetical protein